MIERRSRSLPRNETGRRRPGGLRAARRGRYRRAGDSRRARRASRGSRDRARRATCRSSCHLRAQSSISDPSPTRRRSEGSGMSCPPGPPQAASSRRSGPTCNRTRDFSGVKRRRLERVRRRHSLAVVSSGAIWQDWPDGGSRLNRGRRRDRSGRNCRRSCRVVCLAARRQT